MKRKYLLQKLLVRLKLSVTFVFVSSSSFFFFHSTTVFTIHLPQHLLLSGSKLPFFNSLVPTAWWNPVSWNWFGYKNILSDKDLSSRIAFFSLGLFLIFTIGFSVSSAKMRSSLHSLLDKPSHISLLSPYLIK